MNNRIGAPKYKVGDKVRHVNDYGVDLGIKTITAIEFEQPRKHRVTLLPSGNVVDEYSQPQYRYHTQETDTPWFATSEKNLFPV